KHESESNLSHEAFEVLALFGLEDLEMGGLRRTFCFFFCWRGGGPVFFAAFCLGSSASASFQSTRLAARSPARPPIRAPRGPAATAPITAKAAWVLFSKSASRI